MFYIFLWEKASGAQRSLALTRMYKLLWTSTQKLREIIWIAHLHETTECELKISPINPFSFSSEHVLKQTNQRQKIEIFSTSRLVSNL